VARVASVRPTNFTLEWIRELINVGTCHNMSFCADCATLRKRLNHLPTLSASLISCALKNRNLDEVALFLLVLVAFFRVISGLPEKVKVAV